MKYLTICVTVLIALSSCGKKKEGNQDSLTGAANVSIKNNLCYMEVTQSKDNPAIRDTMSLTVNFNGNKVSGIYNWLPYEKDKKTGTYEGQLMDSVVNAVYTYSAEGENLKEELVFKLENSKVMIKSGELAEKDGIWKIKDLSKAEYSMKLNQVPCK